MQIIINCDIMYKILFVNWNSEKVNPIIDLFQNLSCQLSFTFNREQTLNELSHEKIDLIVIQQFSSSSDCLYNSEFINQPICPEIPIMIANEGFFSDKNFYFNLFLKIVGNPEK